MVPQAIGDMGRGRTFTAGGKVRAVCPSTTLG
jgi:hypothetical protein